MSTITPPGHPANRLDCETADRVQGMMRPAIGENDDGFPHNPSHLADHCFVFPLVEPAVFIRKGI